MEPWSIRTTSFPSKVRTANWRDSWWWFGHTKDYSFLAYSEKSVRLLNEDFQRCQIIDLFCEFLNDNAGYQPLPVTGTFPSWLSSKGRRYGEGRNDVGSWQTCLSQPERRWASRCKDSWFEPACWFILLWICPVNLINGGTCWVWLSGQFHFSSLLGRCCLYPWGRIAKIWTCTDAHLYFCAGGIQHSVFVQSCYQSRQPLIETSETLMLRNNLRVGVERRGRKKTQKGEKISCSHIATADTVGVKAWH